MSADFRTQVVNRSPVNIIYPKHCMGIANRLRAEGVGLSTNPQAVFKRLGRCGEGYLLGIKLGDSHVHFDVAVIQ